MKCISRHKELLKLISTMQVMRLLDQLRVDTELSNQELADKTDTHPQNVSRTIKELEFQEVVEKNSRGYLLTKAGHQLIAELDRSFQNFYDEL